MGISSISTRAGSRTTQLIHRWHSRQPHPRESINHFSQDFPSPFSEKLKTQLHNKKNKNYLNFENQIGNSAELKVPRKAIMINDNNERVVTVNLECCQAKKRLRVMRRLACGLGGWVGSTEICACYSESSIEVLEFELEIS